MVGVESEDAKRFVRSLREGVANVIDETRVRLYLPQEDKLFAPATITAALILSALDHATRSGLTTDQFVELLEKFSSQLKSLNVDGSRAT